MPHKPGQHLSLGILAFSSLPRSIPALIHSSSWLTVSNCLKESTHWHFCCLAGDFCVKNMDPFMNSVLLWRIQSAHALWPKCCRHLLSQILVGVIRGIMYGGVLSWPTTFSFIFSRCSCEILLLDAGELPLMLESCRPVQVPGQARPARCHQRSRSAVADIRTRYQRPPFLSEQPLWISPNESTANAGSVSRMQSRWQSRNPAGYPGCTSGWISNRMCMVIPLDTNCNQHG